MIRITWHNRLVEVDLMHAFVHCSRVGDPQDFDYKNFGNGEGAFGIGMDHPVVDLALRRRRILYARNARGLIFEEFDDDLIIETTAGWWVLRERPLTMRPWWEAR